MAPFSIPTPHIVPLDLTSFGAPKSLSTNTKIELFCETCINHEIFYTLDGTKPQPYAGIVQGNETIKYVAPFSLPAGKITVRAIAIHAKMHSMFSNVITKNFKVVKAEERHSSTKFEKNKDKGKANEPASLNEPSTSNDIVDEVSDHISDDNTHNSQKSLSNGILRSSNLGVNIELSDEEELLNNSHNSSQDTSSIGESLDEDKTLFENENVLLLEENSSKEIKNSTFFLGNEDVVPDFSIGAGGLNDKGDLILLGTSDLNSSLYSCKKCEKDSEICTVCQERNTLSAKHCIYCGQRLKKICSLCKEDNPMISKFCQYCGHKLYVDGNETPEINLPKLDETPLIKKKSVGVQSSVASIEKYVQFSPTKVKNPLSPVLKQLPPHSPGRGYWHQQLDFICNNLKSHAYNDIEFRKSISRPMLSSFQSANVIENDDNIVVTLTFLPFNNGKQNNSVG
ncbi:double zinc ribbon and ankyrin repeat-containing protein 1 [Parasteatoda tepidariorum]|uniref:double zinc ribbon and ankyrin repeat-containing protein 1 n=1 Tax=Parasteatoda tepidariorum TaxID=114398 RepID=UPI00077FB360|nr:double zinc ribbon and ankyrin repeat-containing protein 1 [Parasteatoda tepidariorum]XP_042901126.1 double zinc ribbon and ankyrin repeat-containing protein 1 [Parasteatoda tepidariorum]XP_042901127.1 double zinc ribbon and ankyrin repeat-containing protein 1 [Parasteatoda tepidariorum]